MPGKRFYVSGAFFLCLVVIACNVNAQIPSGSWRDHLPYKHGLQLAEFDSRMFCASSDGSLFSCNMKDRTIKKHSKANGLSDAFITAIGSSQTTNTFFIGYNNGNIDLIRNDSIINIPDIKRKMLTGAKTINQVFFLNQYAYLACSFGIVVCDLNRREIKDTYFFGPLGSQIHVNNIASDGQYLFAATDKGIFQADLSDPNLLDYNAWVRINTLPDPEANYKYIVVYRQKLYTIYTHGSPEMDDIIEFDASGWEIWDQNPAEKIYFLGVQNSEMIVSTANRTRSYNQSGQPELDFVSYFARHLVRDSRNNLWYAAWFGGLVSMDISGGNNAVFSPDGPEFRDVGDIEIFSGETWVAGGTFNSQWLGYGAFSFIDEKWNQFNGNTLEPLKNFLNISEIAIDPQNPGHILGGSYGFGVAEFLEGNLVDIEDETGGVLRPVTGYENIPGYVRVTGADFDLQGNAFIAVSNSETGVYKKPSGGNWEPLEMDYEDFSFDVNTGDILATSKGQIWLCLHKKGLLVFEESNAVTTRERFFTVRNQEGDIFDEITSIAEDKDGNIWVGTNKGPVVYNNPDDIFEAESVIAYQPLVPRNDGTNYASLLLSSEYINDIEIDGGNRKWFATEKSGVFLISPDGRKEIQHFTESNSPLFSDNVITLAVHDITGEVLFGTEIGIVGYRGGATEGEDDFSKAYVFPNPVRENFEGDITVTGLVQDVNVKITDISGNLVYETVATGGSATWNGRNFNGDRVHTGVYLIFCTNEDGSKTFVTKLLFIH